MPDISEDVGSTEETADVHNTLFGPVQGSLASILGMSPWPSGYTENTPDSARKTIEAVKRAHWQVG